MIIRFFFIFITLLCFAVQTEAHVDGFRNLTLRDGLPGMSVISLCEEPSGSVWIGTSNGIAFYNGMSVKTYALPLTPNRQPLYVLR